MMKTEKTVKLLQDMADNKPTKGYHLTITDEETGDVVIDKIITAIVGGYKPKNEQGAYGIGMSRCDILDLLSTACTAIKSVNKLTDSEEIDECIDFLLSITPKPKKHCHAISDKVNKLLCAILENGEEVPIPFPEFV